MQLARIFVSTPLVQNLWTGFLKLPPKHYIAAIAAVSGLPTEAIYWSEHLNIGPWFKKLEFHFNTHTHRPQSMFYTLTCPQWSVVLSRRTSWCASLAHPRGTCCASGWRTTACRRSSSSLGSGRSRPARVRCVGVISVYTHLNILIKILCVSTELQTMLWSNCSWFLCKSLQVYLDAEMNRLVTDVWL